MGKFVIIDGNEVHGGILCNIGSFDAITEEAELLGETYYISKMKFNNFPKRFLNRWVHLLFYHYGTEHCCSCFIEVDEDGEGGNYLVTRTDWEEICKL